MNTDLFHPNEEDGSIAHVQATPTPDNGAVYSREQVSRTSRFFRWVSSWFFRGDDFSQEYLDSKKATQANSADKIAKEAADLKAKADNTEKETEKVSQEVVNLFVKNLADINELPEVQQIIAYAKLFEQNPQLHEQVDVVTNLLDTLRLTRGLSISPAPKPSLITEEIESEESQQE